MTKDEIERGGCFSWDNKRKKNYVCTSAGKNYCVIFWTFFFS